jgi:phytoene dehydrogenase-like protein
VVVGAGLGGLLAAAAIAKKGGSVLVLERLRYVGGRFTTVDQDGYGITTGALHMLPHGGGGPLARAMRELGLAFEMVPRDMMASFHFRGQHVLWNRPWDVMRLFGAQGRLDLLKITTMLSAPFAPARSEAQPFSDWLATQTRERTLHHFFASFIEFAVSVQSDQISFGEMRAIHQHVLRHGMPGIPVGGCAAVIQALVDFIRAHHGEIRTGVEVARIVVDDTVDRVQGVEFRNRHAGDSVELHVPLVVSDAGPEATRRLLNSAGPRVLGDMPQLDKAAGLKLHIVSTRSLIPHNGIMLCLDKRRISGMVEVSRAVPSVVPSGMHMIDTFQVMRSDSLTEERDLAVADLRDIFGNDFDRHCHIVRASAFRSRWPVNQARQGADLHDQEPVPGLLMVGDAYKPKGYIMAEGVAAGVRRIAPRLPGTHSSEHQARRTRAWASARQLASGLSLYSVIGGHSST